MMPVETKKTFREKHFADNTLQSILIYFNTAATQRRRRLFLARGESTLFRSRRKQNSLLAACAGTSGRTILEPAGPHDPRLQPSFSCCLDQE